jgi:hypothetical protein
MVKTSKKKFTDKKRGNKLKSRRKILTGGAGIAVGVGGYVGTPYPPSAPPDPGGFDAFIKYIKQQKIPGKTSIFENSIREKGENRFHIFSGSSDIDTPLNQIISEVAKEIATQKRFEYLTEGELADSKFAKIKEEYMTQEEFKAATKDYDDEDLADLAFFSYGNNLNQYRLNSLRKFFECVYGEDDEFVDSKKKILESLFKIIKMVELPTMEQTPVPSAAPKPLPEDTEDILSIFTEILQFFGVEDFVLNALETAYHIVSTEGEPSFKEFLELVTNDKIQMMIGFKLNEEKLNAIKRLYVLCRNKEFISGIVKLTSELSTLETIGEEKKGQLETEIIRLLEQTTTLTFQFSSGANFRELKNKDTIPILIFLRKLLPGIKNTLSGRLPNFEEKLESMDLLFSLEDGVRDFLIDNL